MGLALTPQSVLPLDPSNPPEDIDTRERRIRSVSDCTGGSTDHSSEPMKCIHSGNFSQQGSNCTPIHEATIMHVAGMQWQNNARHRLQLMTAVCIVFVLRLLLER